MGFIKESLKFIVDDFKSDYIFLKEISDGTRKVDLKRLKSVKIGSVIKANWLMFLLCAGFFCSGYFIAAQDYQDECNTFIIEEIIPKCEKIQDYQQIMDGTFDLGSVHLINFSNI